MRGPLTTSDPESDRYVTVTSFMFGRRLETRTYVNATEALFAIYDRGCHHGSMWEIRTHLKTNLEVMFSGRFQRTLVPPRLQPGTKIEDMNHPWICNLIRKIPGRTKWNYERPFGTRKKPCHGSYTPQQIWRRLHNSRFHVRKPLIIWPDKKPDPRVRVLNDPAESAYETV